MNLAEKYLTERCIIKYRNEGEKYHVKIGNRFLSEDGWMPVDDIDPETLKDTKGDSNWDIIKIYSPCPNPSRIEDLYNPNRSKLIWTFEKIEYTISEIEKALDIPEGSLKIIS